MTRSWRTTSRTFTGEMGRQPGVPLPAELNDPEAALPPGRVVGVLRDIAGHLFPLRAGDAKDLR